MDDYEKRSLEEQFGTDTLMDCVMERTGGKELTLWRNFAMDEITEMEEDVKSKESLR